MSRKKEEIVKDGEKTRFKPGESGNPNGRTKGIPNAATRYRRFLELMKNEKNPVTGENDDLTVAELMDLQQIKSALDGDLAAYKEILDRLEGKAVQSTELTGKDGEAIEVNQSQTIIKIAFRSPEDDEPNVSKSPMPAKGERKKG